MFKFMQNWFKKEAVAPTPTKPQPDPLDLSIIRGQDAWPTQSRGFQTIELRPDLAQHTYNPTWAADSKVNVGDNQGITSGMMSQSNVPEVLVNWYMSQGFIGYQACAIMAQHWLVNKAVSMPAEDAVRKGHTVNFLSGTGGSSQEETNLQAQLVKFNKKMNLIHNMVQFVRFTNIFGIRIAIFEVESDDHYTTRSHSISTV